jgi:uncharacterized protein
MSEPSNPQPIDDQILALLRCPVTRSKLHLQQGSLVAEVGGLRYPIRNGIPVLLAEEAQLPAGISTLEEFRQRFGVR